MRGLRICALADPAPFLHEEFPLLAVGLQIDRGDDVLADQDLQGPNNPKPLSFVTGLETVTVAEEQFGALALDNKRSNGESTPTRPASPAPAGPGPSASSTSGRAQCSCLPAPSSATGASSLRRCTRLENTRARSRSRNAYPACSKTYDLMTRHFGWDKPPKPALSARISPPIRSIGHCVRRASSASIRFAIWRRRARRRYDADRSRVRRKELVPVALEGTGKQEHWARPDCSTRTGRGRQTRSMPAWCTSLPFDPLVIQRKRLALFFGYGHRFEAYVPKEKRFSAISRYRSWSATTSSRPSI